MTAPLLEADRARIDVEGSPAIDGLSFATTSDSVIVLGAPRALFEAASGMRSAAHGEVRVRGQRATDAIREAKIAGAPLDPPLPPRWSARTYVAWSARLAGHAKAPARALADEAVERLRLTAFADQPLVRATPQMRRGVVVAAALATGAAVIALDDPLSGLPLDQARSLGRVLAQALEDRAWIAFAARMPLESPLALHAAEAIVLAGSAVVAQGAPGEIASQTRAFAVRVHGETAAFARRIAERGGKVGGTAARMTVDLGDLSTLDLMTIAHESNTIILELLPLSGAFA